MYLRILCKIHVSDSCLSSFISQGPLQDPCRRIHVSASSYLRILCKIHVSDSCLSIHQNGSSTRSTSSDSCLSIYVSHGFSARPMSPDPCRSIHLYLTILCKIHVSGFMSQHLCISGSSARSMSQHLYISGFSARSMSPIHVLAPTKMDPLQDPRLRIHVSTSMYFMGSLQDPCLRIHVSASFSQDPLQDPCLRIHISASVCISRSSARSMSPDPSLSIFTSQDPCLSIHMYLRILC